VLNQFPSRVPALSFFALGAGPAAHGYGASERRPGPRIPPKSRRDAWASLALGWSIASPSRGETGG
jgi:hypothetical protein